MSKFTVYTDKHNEFRWKFFGSTDTVLARSSDSFKGREECLASVGLMQKDVAGSTIDFQLRKGTPTGPVTPAKPAAVEVKVNVPAPAVAAAAAPAVVAAPASAPAPVVAPVPAVVAQA